MKKMYSLLYRTLVVVCIALTVWSCSEDEPGEKPVLVSSTRILSRSAGELRTFLTASGFSLGSELKYDVDIYKVTYRTLYKNEEITASGIVVLPKTTNPVGMVSFQHGTITAQSEAPSNLSLSNSQLILYSALGSAGFIGVVPDFIGFGESDEIFHPYYVEEVTASAVIDNVKAARDLAAKNNVNFNQKLMLAGYSQGGYATMAAHKSIEENGLSGFDLIASFPAAGGYDVKGMQEYFFSQQTYDQPYYLAYVARSYQSYYEWPNVITQFFKEPYASRILTLFTSTNTAGTINAQLTQVISDFVTTDLIANIDTKAEYKDLRDAFIENSLTDWTPTKRMFMYHGDADTTVPYENSVDTYNQLISNGASPQTVTLKALPGADHGSGVFPYLEEFIEEALPLQ
ncbi:MAG TPA: alpha/beta hydrolase [Chryseosolibacter sp.]